MANRIKQFLLLLGLIGVTTGCVTQRVSEELVLGVGTTYTSNNIEVTPTQVTLYGRSVAIPPGSKTVRVDRHIKNGEGTVSLQFDGRTPTMYVIKKDRIVE